MNAWGEEDPSPDDQEPASRPRRLHGWHLIAFGAVCVALWPLASAAGAVALGPMLMVLGVTMIMFGAGGWALERLGAFDDDPGGPGSIGLTDVAQLAKRTRRD
jgi:hypothetical protein